MALDCLTAGSRPALLPSQLSFAEYTWNVCAPGAGVWKEDPTVDKNKSTTGVPGDYVQEIWLTPDNKKVEEWMYCAGRYEPKEMMYDLLERSCRILYGEKAAPVMAEALRHSCPSSSREWSANPGIASCQLESAQKAFAALISLWGKKDLFTQTKESLEAGLPGQYDTYTGLVKTYADLQFIMKCQTAVTAAAELIEHAKTNSTERLKLAVAAQNIINGYINTAEQGKKDLKVLYEKYNLENIPWFRMLGTQYKTYTEIEAIGSRYIRDLGQLIQETEFLRQAPADAMRKYFLLVPKTARQPVIDADPGDWDLKNPVLTDFTSYSQHVKNRPLKNNADLSAVFYTAWDEKYFYLLAKVADDEVNFNFMTDLWKGDALEFWINGGQGIISQNKEGKEAMECYRGMSSKDAVISIKKTVHDFSHDFELLGREYPEMNGKPGYILEAALPLVFNNINPAPGTGFYFAIGVDDNDTGDQGTQVFFPPTYRHLTVAKGKVTDFAEVVLTASDPTELVLIQPVIEDRTAQDGTDSFLKCRITLKSPIPLSNLKIELIRLTGGQKMKPRLLKNIPSSIPQDSAWESGEMEINLGPMEKNLDVLFRVTGNDIGFETKRKLR